VATRPFQVPYVPSAAQRLDGSVTQLHSAGYRNPRTLPPGPVLVVGGGNSGFQIAEELAASTVIWTTGYRSDYSWMHLLGFVREDAAYLADRITSAPPPFRAGRSGGQGLGLGLGRQQWIAR